jgi:DNA-binding response OmpR family regulator
VSASRNRSAERTILVIDDDEDIVSMLTMVFEFDGYTVLTASGGIEGLGLLTHHRPDLVLLDSRMPRGSGPELVRSVRASADLEGTRILMLSALEPEPTLDVGWVRKPFEVDELLERVRLLLSDLEDVVEVESEKASGT